MTDYCFLHNVRLTCHHIHNKGHSYDDMLRGTGITNEMLSELYCRVHIRQMHAVWENFIELEGPDVSFELGNLTSTWEFGPLGLACLSSATLIDSIKQLKKYSGIAMGLSQFSYEITDSTASLRLASKDISSPAIRRFHIEAMFTLFLNSLNHASGEKVYPLKMTLEVQSQALLETYQQSFHCDNIIPRDCAGVSELVLDREFCEEPLPFADPVLLQASTTLCDSLLNRLEASAPFTDKIRNQLSETQGEFPDTKQMSALMDVSERTLRRNLAREGTSYQTLILDEKRKLATQLLSSGDLSIQYISDACGFKETPNFSAAFKRWTGKTPTDYRASLLSH
ncbi:MAG: hypothetical protein CL693_08305 [Cellvibrionaceae bacterium]|nr:hypothetical protein [Cellvibrionaceae bacterium]|tara:strand:- start:52230 stop:53246 length:1017 start_codon:yes stop_codon:yes gene_type:complete